MMEEVDEFRCRSNTWPMRRLCESETGQSTSSDENNGTENCANLSSNDSAIGLSGESIATQQITSFEPVTCVLPSKKVSSRRNAWGNASYAELITQAINSSSDKRLTLSQIYEWMVHNVPYFKDKGDSNSSAGWKNSIRHNLSLHSRFMRIQNEGTGKSSWWVINPEGKPGKTSNRRRAASMETSKFEKKRGRVRRKLEAVRSGVKFEATSPSSSISEGLDTFPESPPLHSATSHFTLSPETFRPRASSNASSCGRLSPIPCEPDVNDTPISPLTWNSGEMTTPQRPQAHYSGEQHQHPYADQLAEMTFHSMNLEGNSSSIDNSYFTRTADESEDCNQVSPASSQSTLTSLNFTFGSSVSVNSSINNLSNKSLAHSETDSFIDASSNIDACSNTLTRLNNRCSDLSSTSCDASPSNKATVDVHLNTPESMSTGHSNSSFIASHLEPIQRKRALTYSFAPNRPFKSDGSNLLNSQSVSQVFGQLLSINNSLPHDLDLESIQGGLECDVNSVIQHELNVEGNLDFNFDPLNANRNRSSTPVNTSMSGIQAHSCVH